MTRRPSKHLRPSCPPDTSRHVSRRVTSADSFLVREVPGDRALKPYTCPGCNSPILVGVAHLVAWPEELGLGFESGLKQRRH